jgi:two-component system, LytTR family, response regulator
MNTTIKALLIDDEKGNHATLERMLQRFSHVHVLGNAFETAKANELLMQHQFDVVFLDIQMPKQNGIEWLQSLLQINFEIIFITAFDAYALQAIKFSALDYLLKPIDANELELAIAKLEKKIIDKNRNVNLENLLHLMNHQQEKSTHKIALPTNGETYFIKTNEIIFCESTNSYSTFYLQDGRKIMVSKSIKEFEMLLQGYGFVRVHQSFLVNKDMIIGLNKKDGLLLMMQNGAQVPLSKSRKEAVLDLLGL